MAIVVGLSAPAVASVFQQTTLPGALLLVETEKTSTARQFWTDFTADSQLDVASVPTKIIRVPGARNFGDAIREALALNPMDVDPQWLWLLHDDMEAAPYALEELMATADRGGSTAIVAPKQIAPRPETTAKTPGREQDQIIELGIQATRSGLRVNPYEPGEIDQGQYDDRTDVLAAGSAGMLVRADVWKLTGGFDPALGPFGDGLEFGRRVRRAGYRVVVAPKARVFHERRSLGKTADERLASWRARRRVGLYNWLAATKAWAVPLILLWLLIWTPLRMLGRLITRNPQLAQAEWHAYEDLWRLVPSIYRTRKRIRQVAKVPTRLLRRLELSLFDYWRIRRRLRKVRRRQNLERVPLDEAAEQALARHRFLNRAYMLAMTGLAIVLTAVCWYPYSSELTGGAWASLPDSWGELASQAWTDWILAGDGAVGPVNPLLRPLSILTAPFALLGIAPSQVAPWILYAAISLGALGGWALASLVTAIPLAKLAVGLLWVGNPGFLAVMRAGDLSGTIIWLTLPMVVVGMVRCYLGAAKLKAVGIKVLTARKASDPVSWAAIASFGLVFAGSASPFLIVVVLLAGLVVASGLVRRAGSRAAARAALSRTVSQAAETDPAAPTDSAIRKMRGERVLTAPKRWGLLGLIALPAAAMTAPVFARLIALIGSGGGASDTAGTATGTASAADAATGSLSEPLNLFLHPAQILAGNSVSDLLAGDPTWLIWVESLGGLALVLAALVGTIWAIKTWRGRPIVSGLSFTFAGLALCLYLFAREFLGDLALSSLAALGVAALLLAVGAAVPSIVQSGGLQGRSLPVAPLAVSLLGVVLALASVLGGLLVPQLTETFAANADSARVRAAGETQPLLSQIAQQSDRRSRLLTIEVQDGVVSAELLRSTGRQQVDLSLSMGTETAATDSLTQAIATMTVTPSTEVAATLAYHGVDMILVRESSDELESLQRILDATVGLERIGTTDLGTMWRVRPDSLTPARAYLLAADGTLTPVASSASAISETITVDEDSILLLAENASANWQATFAGTSLEATDAPPEVGGWQQAFVIPAGQGVLTVHYSAPWQPWWVGGTLILLAGLALCLIPRRFRSEVTLKVTAEAGAPVSATAKRVASLSTSAASAPDFTKEAADD